MKILLIRKGGRKETAEEAAEGGLRAPVQQRRVVSPAENSVRPTSTASCATTFNLSQASLASWALAIMVLDASEEQCEEGS